MGDTPGSIEIHLASELLVLLPHRAAFWPRQATLLVADLHVGKAAAFRAGGVPIPRGTTGADLARLDEALARTGATRMIVLGDLYHAKEGMSAETIGAFNDWRMQHPDLRIEIVRGNHDVRAGKSPEHLRIVEYENELVDAPFVFRHHPVKSQAGYVLAGHLHPAARLRGRGVRSLRLPCFHFAERVGVLPAFGFFTGTSVVRPKRRDRVFVVTDEEVVAV